MKQIIPLFVLGILLSCNRNTTPQESKPIPQVQPKKVASIKGQQFTGVAIHQGDLYVNFPRWRKQVNYSVAKLSGKNQYLPFPNSDWNSWEIGNPVNDSVFVAVQSVFVSNNKLYVVDTRNPEFKGIIDQPILYVFNLSNNQLERTYKFSKDSFHSDSYVNDIRIDEHTQYAFFTDSGHPGLITLNLNTGEVKRLLNNHYSTTSEVDFLTINQKQWKNTVHADGIALDPDNRMLYYHALTGYHLYAIPIDSLIHSNAVDKSVTKVAKTAAPDGMLVYKGELYYADLEHHKIEKINLKTKEITPITSGDKVKWADSFTIEGNSLFYTNSRIHETSGDITNLEFTIQRIDL